MLKIPSRAREPVPDCFKPEYAFRSLPVAESLIYSFAQGNIL